ncbi:hypothetical protein [Tepidibacter thalassicus]|uniref:hypothetical protein n=1 Tax=Tepidibacter thalassicus TaxID=214905 RepID=UPI000934712A|nr:hypothetical protein [Tepidibacter thalassicus]
MEKLKIDLQLFNIITIENCLNCTPVLHKLDQLIYNKTKAIITKSQNIPDKQEQLLFILTQSLLRISREATWLKLQKEHNLCLQYLYTLIKRQIYMNNPEII